MTTRRIRYRGPLASLTAAERTQLLERTQSGPDDIVRTTCEAIIDVVRREGDSALISLAREYDSVRLKSLEVPRAACEEALDALEPCMLRRFLSQSRRPQNPVWWLADDRIRCSASAFTPLGAVRRIRAAC
jgi:histidinol dehydrogenase